MAVHRPHCATLLASPLLCLPACMPRSAAPRPQRIKFVGGVNKPKIVSVTDSWGASHRQLVSTQRWQQAVAPPRALHTCLAHARTAALPPARAACRTLAPLPPGPGRAGQERQRRPATGRRDAAVLLAGQPVSARAAAHPAPRPVHPHIQGAVHRAGCRAPTRAWKAAGWIAQCAKPACQLRELFPLSPPPQVVPFSPSSGLLEWVEHTQPMADYLLGPSRAGGAHMRYKRRGDYTWVQCYTDVRGGGGGGGAGGVRARRDRHD